MTSLEAARVVYWTVLGVASVLLAVFRRRLTRCVLPRTRWSEGRPGADRLCERSMLLAGVGLVVISITVLYAELVVLPRLNRRLTEIRATQPLSRPPTDGQSI
jgi:hypothetical protein